MANFESDPLIQTFGALSKRKQLAFMLLLCDRTIPALREFGDDTGFDSQDYEQILLVGWTHLLGEPDLEEYALVPKLPLSRPPDTELFDHRLTSAALNAALSLMLLRSFLLQPDVSYLVEAAGLAKDTLALHAQMMEVGPSASPEYEVVMEHPLLRGETQHQAGDLAFLASLPEQLSPANMQLIKDRARNAPALLPVE